MVKSCVTPSKVMVPLPSNFWPALMPS